ncbi:unnamed protein product [Trichogramma brassicae]|uniref:Uncharacterized protein n=1 Tax=Trichogramma brassicae TaxID=86971 RepID=A0A6H5HVL9_9HYME|nr:unnamed protein product [Trichogramma brassicae]
MSASKTSIFRSSTAKLLFCTLGIFVCYSYYAIVHERITRRQYVDGPNTEKFTYMISLVFVSCVVNCLFAKALLMTVMKQGEDTTTVKYYATCSLTYMLAMTCSNMALQFVNYPTQVVGKAGKPIPVMILGVLLGGKSYPLKKYVFVSMVVLGVVMFMYKDNVPSKQLENEGFGQILLILSLIMDGLTSAVQDRMRANHKTKSGHMMLNMNLWSVGFNIHLLYNILQHSPCGALGQYFIFLTVSEYGPLACSIATTTRKCFTVLASVLFFGNSMLPRQWLATFIVFFGLFLDGLYGKSPAKVLKKEVSK